MTSQKLLSSLLAMLLFPLLSACGGGSGGGAAAPAPAPAAPSKLAPYLGNWSAACDGREQEKITIAQDAAGGDRMQVAIKTEYYANLGCTGALVATETTSIPSVQLTITGSTNAGVVYAAGTASVSTAIDLVSASAPAHTRTVTGSAVQHTVKNGQAQWCIDFGGGNSTCVYDEGSIPPQGSIQAAIAVRGGELYLLTPNGSLYVVEDKYSR